MTTILPRPTGSGRPRDRGMTILLPAVAYFMVTLDALVVVTAFAVHPPHPGGGISALQWTISATPSRSAPGS